MGHGDGVERLGDGANLVKLDQDRVPDSALDALLEDGGVGDEDVVATICTRAPNSFVSACQPFQSPSARPSSIEMMGYFDSQSAYSAIISAEVRRHRPTS